MAIDYFDEKFILGEEIGRGGDGIVRCAKQLNGQKEFAVKIISLQNSNDEYFFNSERAIMHKLNKYNHKNIIRSDFFLNENHCEGYIVMEKLSCDLWSYVHSKGYLDEREAKIIIKQVCKALAFMNSKKICHLDIKLDNIDRRKLEIY